MSDEEGRSGGHKRRDESTPSHTNTEQECHPTKKSKKEGAAVQVALGGA
jgi:hypothetical protein